MGEGAAKDGVFAMTLGEGLHGEAATDGVGADAALERSWRVVGFSKSQGTPCFTQFPHLGCTSSHYEGGH